MRSTYAQWLRYAAYTLLVLGVVVGGYYFVYVQQEKRQLANDRLALLQESSGYFTEELGRVQANIENTLQDTSKLASTAKLDSVLEEISGIPHASSGHWDEDSTRCLGTAESYGRSQSQNVELYAQFEPSVSHSHLYFTLDDVTEPDGGKPCKLAAANPDSLLIPLLPRSETAFDKVFLARDDGRVLVSSGTGSISMVRLPLGHQAPVDEDSLEAGSKPGGLHSEIFTMEAAGISHRVFLQPFTVPVDITYTEGDSTREDKETLYLAGVKQERALRAEARMLPPTLLAILLGAVALALLAFPFLEMWFIGPTESFQAHDVVEVAVGVVIACSIVTLAALGFFYKQQFEERQFDQLESLSGVIRATLHTEAKAANQQLTRLTKLVRSCDSNCRQQTRIWKDSVRVDGSITAVSDSAFQEDSLNYPHLEMASWINQEAKQVAKWSVEDQTTPLVELDERGYVRAHEGALERPWSASRHSEVWEYPKGESTEWVLESIRSKNTGEVFAQISQRPDSGIEFKRDTTNARAVVAAATLPLLSVIDPILPPGFRFAVIDGTGNVLFHSDARRNLRENIFDKIIDGEPLRDAVFARNAERATLRYREDRYQFYSHPVSDSPWTLLVFAELQPLSAMYGHILTGWVALYGGYLLLLFLVLLFWVVLNPNIRFSVQGLVYSLWPDREKGASYQSLLWGEGAILILGLALVPVLAVRGGVFSVGGLVGAFLLAVLALLLFCYHCSGAEPILDDGVDLSSRLKWLLQSLGLEQFLGVDWTDWRDQYLGGVFFLVLNIGVLPVLVSYTIVQDESAELLQKQKQLVLAQRLQARGEQWGDQYRGDDQGIALDATARGMLRAYLFPRDAWTIPEDSLEVWTAPDKSLNVRPWDVHAVPTFGIESIEDERTSEKCGSGDAAGAVQPVHQTLSENQLIDNTSFWGRNLHPFSDSESSDASWTWTETRGSSAWRELESDTLTLCTEASRRAGLLPAGTAGRDGPDLRIRSPVPTAASLSQLGFGTAVLILFFVAVLPVLLWWALRTLNDQMFFMGLAPIVGTEGMQSTTTGQSERPDRILLLRGHPDGDSADAAEYCVVDGSLEHRDGETSDGHLSEVEGSNARVVIRNFHDGLRSAEIVERKQALLEDLVELDTDVEVHSDVDPLPYLRDQVYESDRTEEREADATASSPVDLDAWATVLRRFRKASAASKPDPESGEVLEELRSALGLSDDQPVPDPVEALARECSVDPYLRHRIGQIESAVLGDREAPSLSEEQVVEQLKYHARAHYQHLWMTCTDEEKVILYRLSTDGFVSPHSRDIVEQLLRRGLLVMDPELRLMNRSFRRFVAALDSPVIARYEEEASSTTWRRVRGPLLIASALVIGFVFYTQPGRVQEWMGVLAPALAAGLPALINVFSGLFLGQPADGSGL